MIDTPNPAADAVLLPCPFCGVDDAFVERYDYSSAYVFCNGCGAKGALECQYNDDEEIPGKAAAVIAWNTRATLATPAPKPDALDARTVRTNALEEAARVCDLAETLDFQSRIWMSQALFAAHSIRNLAAAPQHKDAAGVDALEEVLCRKCEEVSDTTQDVEREIERLRNEVAHLRVTLGQASPDGVEPIGCPLPGACSTVWRPAAQGDAKLVALSDEQVRRAVDAYDAARCAEHGHDVAVFGMSVRNKQSIAPMIRAAILAAAPRPASDDARDVGRADTERLDFLLNNVGFTLYQLNDDRWRFRRGLGSPQSHGDTKRAAIDAARQAAGGTE